MSPDKDQPRGQAGDAGQFGNRPRPAVDEKTRKGLAHAASAAAGPIARIDRQKWLADELAQRRLIRVAASMRDAGILVNEAAVTAKAAAQVSDAAPAFALSGYWDATRKAITAHMTANGLAIDNKPGAHKRAVEYAEATFDELTDPEIDAIDALRDDRNDSEYGIHPRLLEKIRLQQADKITRRVIAVVTRRLRDQHTASKK